MNILLELFITFFKIGAFTFGGGYAMLPLIQSEIISHGWMELSDLVNFIAIAESTPGPFAVNISTYVGRVIAGIPGAIICTIGANLPSVIVIVVIAHFFEKFKDNKYIAGMMSGLRPTVIALIGSSVVSIGKTVFFHDGLLVDTKFFISLFIFILAMILTFKKKNPILVILISALLGIGFGIIFKL